MKRLPVSCVVMSALLIILCYNTRAQPASTTRPRISTAGGQSARQGPQAQPNATAPVINMLPESKEETATEKQDIANGKTLNVLTGVLIFVGAIQAVIFGVQARIFFKQEGWLRQTVQQMQNASNDAKASIAAAQEANKMSHVSLLATQRAFVFIETIGMAFIDLTGDEHNPHAIIELKWKNGGHTPTQHLLYAINCKLFHNHDMPGNFEFYDTDADGDAVEYGARSNILVLGPSGSETIWMTVPRSWITGTLAGNFLYVWGWAEYDDVLSDRRHRTEFCYKVSMSPVMNRQTANPNHVIGFNPYRRHNGAAEGEWVHQPRPFPAIPDS